MTPADFTQLIASIIGDQNLIAKILLLIFLSLYGFFAIILLIQVRELSKIVNQVGFTPVIKGLSVLHLGIVLVLLAVTAYV